MPYVELSDLEGQIPPEFLTQALDDNNDDYIDAWEKVQESACEEVDALLEGRFSVPLAAPVPRVVKRAAITFACELCYRRRGTPDDQNPWVKRADATRKMLAMITAGDLKLQAQPAVAEPDPPGSIHTWESELGAPGRLLG
jgi:phage gp36-like protein